MIFLNQISKRLTYANVMSSIAVFLVLGGATAFAATHLGKNSVGNKQLKKNAVTNAKIKKDAVTGAKVKNGSLTGSDINLGTLGTVPTAAKSDQLVNVFYKAQTGPAKTTILNFQGLTITAECETEDVQLTATTSVNHTIITFFTPQDGDYEFNENFNVGETFDADDGHDEGVFSDIYTIRYSRPDGINVQVELQDVDPDEAPAPFGGSPGCFVGGFAVSA
jgi:hypothetical protein